MRKGQSFSDILIQTSPAFFVAISADGKTMKMNEAMLSALGYTVDEVVGKDYLTTFVSKSDREMLSQVFEELVKSHKSTVNENRILTKDGRELLVVWHGRPIFTKGGEFDFFLGLGIDITEQKIAQERIAHLNLVLRAIRNVNQLIAGERDRDRLLQGACDCLIETRGYHTAWIGLLDEEKGLVTIGQAGRREESAVSAAQLQRGELPLCAQRALAQPGVQVIKEPHSECADCPLSGTYRGRGVMAVRLEHAGKVYGILAADIPVGLISDKEEGKLFAEVAADIAFALHGVELEEARRQTMQELRESEASYRGLFDGVPVGLYRSTPAGRIIDVNPALVKMLSYPNRETLLTVNVLDLYVDPENRRQEQILLKQEGSVQGVEMQLRCRDGKIIWVRDSVRVVKDEHGQERYYEGSLEDVTAQVHAQETLRKSERRLRIMSSVLAELSQSERLVSGDLNACLKEITEAAARTLEVERVNVWLYDEEGSKIHCIDQYELSPRRHSRGYELAAADNPAYFRALEEERAIVVDDAHTDPRTKEFSEAYLSPHGITSMLDAPIRLGGRMIGTICHEHVGPARRWALDEQNFASSMADFISLAMEAQKRRQAEEALKESSRKMESLHVIARRLAICKTADKVYRLTVDAAEKILDFSLCTLDIVTDDKLVVKATSSGLPPEVSVGRPLDEGGLAAKTYRTGETTLFGKMDEVPEATPTRENFRSGISAPIGDIGVFQVVSTQTGAFTEDDVRRLELLLGHTAEAIKRINLQNELREQAIRDSLTGVYNRRYLTQRIEQEISRAKRYERPIAFLMIDVNRFKEINDRFGHQTGDCVLQAVGSLLAQQMREEDIVVRYGGDEFLIVLPETNGETDIVKERILTAVAHRNETNKLIDFPVTLSIGSAYWSPGGSESIEEVLAKADRRMYEEKRRQEAGDGQNDEQVRQ